MENKINIEELLHESEGPTLDFKSEQYKFVSADDNQKGELLKDILAFANAWRRTDAFILIGVEEVKGGKSKPIGIGDDLDDANLQQFVNSKTQRKINFSYSTTLIENVKIGVIRIPVQKRPFYILKDFGKLKKEAIYFRSGSSTNIATPDEVYEMGSSELNSAIEIPELCFEFADLENRTSFGTKLAFNALNYYLPTNFEIPDYKPIPTHKSNILEQMLNSHGYNINYYRDFIKYHFLLKKTKELGFMLKNDSTKVITDIRVEILIEKIEAFNFFKVYDFPEKPILKKHLYSALKLNPHEFKNNKSSIIIQDLTDQYRIEVLFEKVQPKQTIFSEESIFIEANEYFDIPLDVNIFADNIPLPINKKLNISCVVTHKQFDLNEIKKLEDEK